MSSIPSPSLVRFLLLVALLLGTAAIRADDASDLAQRVYDRPNGRDFEDLLLEGSSLPDAPEADTYSTLRTSA
ncbi:MAG: hypothetical protein ABS93_01275 [Thiobacillus sp. SCN 62-729]|nr:MAG: hypothetical protein ABS93_01275 [Thiobacillus sp. SCN 62-729]